MKSLISDDGLLSFASSKPSISKKYTEQETISTQISPSVSDTVPATVLVETKKQEAQEIAAIFT